MYNPSRRYSHERISGGYAPSSTHPRRKIITKPKHIIPSQISDKVQMCKPVAVAVSPQDGKIIVADQELNQLLLFDRKYKFVKCIGKSGSGECEFYHIKSVNISAQGDVVVADTGNHRIQVLSPSGEFVREFGKRGKAVGEFSDMTDIVVDTQNRIYVCDCGNNRVQVLDLNGRFIREFGCCGSKIGDVDHPQGITVCPSTGSVILADTNNKRVQVSRNTHQ
jgi:DNA-binding beta-propeller fold protein YncE